MQKTVRIWQQYRLQNWLLLFLVLALLVLPLPQFVDPENELITNSLLLSFTQMFILIIIASDWNLIGGFTGYIDFGHAVFFGIGAYGTGIMMVKVDWRFLPALLVGAVAAAIFALLIGSATLRLKGPYFSIAMLGTFVAMREIMRVARPLTGGGTGLTLPPYLNRPLFYYVTLLLAIVVVGFAWWLRRTQFGATLIAIREDEVGAEMRGIHTTRHKTVIFVIAAFFTGIVGGIWAYQNTFIDPDVVFFQSRVVEPVMTTILGGLGTVAGPVLGAGLLYWLQYFVWANLLEAHLIAQGVLLIIIVLFVPEGIMGSVGDPSATSLGRLWNRYLRAPVEEGEIQRDDAEAEARA